MERGAGSSGESGVADWLAIVLTIDLHLRYKALILATKIQNQVPLHRRYTGANPEESFRLLSDVGIHIVETGVHALLAV